MNYNEVQECLTVTASDQTSKYSQQQKIKFTMGRFGKHIAKVDDATTIL